MGLMSELTSANWDAVRLRQDRPVIVDVWAPWCRPCQKMTPMVERLSQRAGDRVYCYQLNAEKDPELAARLGVLNLPTVLRFDTGRETVRITGVPEEAKFLERLGLL